MINNKILKIRKEWKSKRLKLKSVPKSDENKTHEIVYENIKIRMKHLAKILFEIKKIYDENPGLYSDDLLAFVGDKVVRYWPNKDNISNAN